jgi:tripartite ATP-independent transporter DctM subunit
MSPEVIGGLGFLVLFMLMAIGLPIGVSMGTVGFVGLCFILPLKAAFVKMAITPYDLVSSYTFASLPLFLLMGHVILSTGQGASLFNASKKLFGRVPGGLAMATILASAAFGAIAASAIATAVTMGLFALPEMKKMKYNDGLASATIAIGGAAGGLIPPSGFLLLYGIITENSIAKLFVAGTIPGSIVAASYILVIALRCWHNPTLGPPARKYSIREKVGTLKDIWELLLLIIFTLGGLIIGVFTATEAGAVGAFGTFVSAAIRGKLNWAKAKEALLGTMKTCGMIYGVIVGAMIFNFFCAASDLPVHLTNWVASFALPPMGIMTIIVIIYFILGALMDENSILLLTLPIFYPLVMNLGFDPIWFGVILTRLLEIGMVAPPIGITVFVVAGLDKSVPMWTIYKGVLWFIVADIITMVMFMRWPSIIMCLPNIMK